jgi:hypothetical protein
MFGSTRVMSPAVIFIASRRIHAIAVGPIILVPADDALARG